MLERVLAIETSGKIGHVGVAANGVLLAERELSEARRHARDLTMRCRELLNEQAWRPRDLTCVVVSIGPGSFTGLRVGLASAKTLAYTLGCPLLAVPTFDAIVDALDGIDGTVDVISDALQGMIYVTRYRKADGWEVQEPLRICPASEWAAKVSEGTTVAGPGVSVVEPLLPAGVNVVPPERRQIKLAGLIRLAASQPKRYQADPWSIEPIYLRGSSAEEKRKALTASGSHSHEMSSGHAGG